MLWIDYGGEISKLLTCKPFIFLAFYLIITCELKFQTAKEKLISNITNKNE